MAVMDRRQEKIQATRHAEIVALLGDVRQKVLDLFTGDIGDVNVAAYMLELQQERDTLQALLSDVIRERNELLDDLEAQVLHDTSDVEARYNELYAQHLLVNRDFEALKEAYEALAAGEAQVSSDLVECQLDLKNTEAALETAKARRNEYRGHMERVISLLRCEASMEAVEAAIVALKRAPMLVAPFAVQAGIQVTPLAETVRELASRGHKAEGIHRIINQRSEPSAVINLAGIRAIYDMVVPK